MNKYDDYNPHIVYYDEGEESSQIGAESLSRKRSGKKGGTSKTPVPSVSERIKAFFLSRTTTAAAGIILAGIAAYFLISFVSYIGACISDQSVIYNNKIGSLPEVANKGGEGGARLSEMLINGGYGLGAFVVIFWLVFLSLKLLVGKPRFKTLDFTLKCIIGFITLSLIVGLFTIHSNTMINWGGYHGRYVNEWIIGFFGWSGAVILCMVMVGLFVVICLRDVIKWILAKKRILDAKRREIMERRAEEKAKAMELQEQRRREMELEETEEATEDETGKERGVVFNGTGENGEPSEGSSWHDAIIAPGENTMSEETLEGNEGNTVIGAVDDDNLYYSTESGEGGESSSEPMVVNINQIAKGDEENTTKARARSLYQFPPLSLMKAGENKISVNAEEQLANKEKIKQTLQEYGVTIVSIEAHVGPTVTLYEIRLDKGHKISRIKGLVDEIALSLAAIGVRIIAPIPGRGTIGIEVANMKPQTVSLRTILESRKYQESKASLPIALGSTISNDVYIADLASMPHLLVAGATGQGKSVGLNVIIMSLLYKLRPEELKFVMFDPKMVEFNLYAAIQKQFLAKLPEEEEAIVTDMNKVVPTLKSLCIEMDNRYKLLKEAEVKKVEEYNKLIKTGKLKDKPAHRFLPYIIVVVDEFADLIMTAGKEAELPIARLAQKARAVGIHVIIATQRPSTSVITGKIKANCPGRIGFKVSTAIDSRVILDTTGAQQLIGRGDMLILNNSELVRVQCAFIDTPEIKAICEHIAAQPAPLDSPYILPEPNSVEEGSMETTGNMTPADRDPMYEEIRQYVIMSGVASTSNIQRKYSLGYNRAGRIMDQLEADGVVGPSQGGKPRTVLIST